MSKQFPNGTYLGECAQQRAVAAAYVEYPTRRSDGANLQELLDDDLAPSAWSALCGGVDDRLFDAASLMIRLVLR